MNNFEKSNDWLFGKMFKKNQLKSEYIKFSYLVLLEN